MIAYVASIQTATKIIQIIYIYITEWQSVLTMTVQALKSIMNPITATRQILLMRELTKAKPSDAKIPNTTPNIQKSNEVTDSIVGVLAIQTKSQMIHSTSQGSGIIIYRIGYGYQQKYVVGNSKTLYLYTGRH